MAKIFPNIPLLDVENQDPVTLLVSEGTYEGVPPTSFGGVFALECLITDLNGTGIYQNTGTVAIPVWTLISANIADDAVTADKVADDAVTADKVADDAVTADKVADDAIVLDKLNIAVKTVSVLVGQVQGSSVADATLAGGQILGYYPITNQDQFVTNVTLNVSNEILIGLLAPATAQNDFNVVILKAA